MHMIAVTFDTYFEFICSVSQQYPTRTLPLMQKPRMKVIPNEKFSELENKIPMQHIRCPMVPERDIFFLP